MDQNIRTYPLLIESPITRQLNFPGVLAIGGPDLQMRLAAIAVEMFPVFITTVSEACAISNKDNLPVYKMILVIELINIVVLKADCPLLEKYNFADS